MHRKNTLHAFKTFLEHNNLYVFTINGFPFGQFHGRRVKENVYKPDWQSYKRRNYTIRLANILSKLLPDGVEGSISTVPGTFKPWAAKPGAMTAMIENLMHVVAHLRSIHVSTGRMIHLGLEPEPACFLETTDEVISFFQNDLDTTGAAYLSRLLKCSAGKARSIIRTHLGICFDTCHLALQFEDLKKSLRALTKAGIRISKVQISAALTARPGCPTARLREFDDRVYLHQVIIGRNHRRLRSFTDLPLALSQERKVTADWRIHCHVPLYFKGSASLGTTANLLTRGFFSTATECGASHFEIETYTFGVLPAQLRELGVITSISREFIWLAGKL